MSERERETGEFSDELVADGVEHRGRSRRNPRHLHDLVELDRVPLLLPVVVDMPDERLERFERIVPLACQHISP